MPLTAITYRVYMDPEDQTDALAEPVVYDVEVRPVDQLKAELEGKRIGVTLDDKMHLTYLWAWAAMVRTGQVSRCTFKDWIARCAGLDEDEVAIADVDPTQPTPSDDSA